jgi:integration host factor subunit beta
MTRAGLVTKLIEANPHLSEREADIVVTTIFGEIVAALCRGDRVELRGFGSFRAKHRGARGVSLYSRALGLAPNRSLFLW